ncbi:hypothetical protein FXN61_26335 [Lentzea sp. PSKA42]|uniref:Condensation domain-containing protein n=1 Tax=Lentzea indica TaxID=2604800 RepID=A0ABX1FNH9_9PSEU|nr:hypothetical protein [Lentzea indica]
MVHVDLPGAVEPSDDPGAAIKAVKEQLRAVPRRGVGYGVLRWLQDDLAGAPDRPVLFNYLGAFDAVDSVGLIRQELPAELAGPSEGEGGTRSHLLQIEVQQSADGRLSIEWFHSGNIHDTATVERVAARYVEALSELVAHCRSAGGFTPSDFPLASLTQDEMDGLAERYPLVDVYRLAPVQSGMLFGVVGAPVDGLYWGQGVYDLAGPLDAERLAAAWREVIARHAPLCSGFVWEGVSEPVQIVLADVDVPLQLRDWSSLDESAQQVQLQELLAEDRALGFDLARPPLTRLYLVDRGDGRNWLVWGLYQGLCDGWSLPVVMDEVSAAYQRHSLPPVRPYRDYIAWLDQRDPADTEGFWRTYLDGFEAPTPLPTDRLAASHYDQDRRRTQLSEGVTARLVELARRERVTLSTVVQAAWAKVLSASSGEHDVVFGLTVSGRPADLAGVESMVGLFINTLPVRAAVPVDTRFARGCTSCGTTRLRCNGSSTRRWLMCSAGRPSRTAARCSTASWCSATSPRKSCRKTWAGCRPSSRWSRATTRSPSRSTSRPRSRSRPSSRRPRSTRSPSSGFSTSWSSCSPRWRNGLSSRSGMCRCSAPSRRRSWWHGGGHRNLLLNSRCPT